MSPAPVSGPGGAPPEKLVFRPDSRKQARVTAARRLLLIAALVIVGAAIVFVSRYRPPVPVLPETAPAVAHGDTGVATVPSPPFGLPAPAATDEAGPLVRGVQVGIAAVQGFWSRAEQLRPRLPLDSAELPKAVNDLRSVSSLLDSAGSVLARLRQASGEIVGIARRLEARRSYEASRYKAALDDALALLDAQQADLRLASENLLLVATAVAGGNAAEAEIKSNVAGSYEVRLGKRAGQIKDKIGALEDAARRFLAPAAR
ncbi:MAG: hypothetical protein R6X12_07005 [bacterium]